MLTIWHPGKGKTTEMLKRSGVSQGWNEKDGQAEHREF